MVSLEVPSKNNQNCPLCSKPANYYVICQNRNYYKCNNCFSIFLSSINRLNSHDEKKRYMEHNNDTDDKDYRKFVSPITNHIIKNFNINTIGLDYGAGTGPVVSCVLDENGYKINKYDPFFFPDDTALGIKYDYIVCCEVIEHFFNPKKEFSILYKMLKNKGEIICKTELLNKDIDFINWYYKNDQAHAFFYSENTFSWIAGNLGFSSVFIDKRIIILTKG